MQHSQTAHWRARDFQEHEVLEPVYELAFDYIDKLMERVQTFHLVHPETFSEAEYPTTSVHEVQARSSVAFRIQNMIKATESVIADEALSPTTEDLLVNLAQDLQEQLYLTSLNDS